MKRMWINQPSSLQTFHKLHGTCVLAVPECVGKHRIYFLSGDVLSQQVGTEVLSKGWPDHLMAGKCLP